VNYYCLRFVFDVDKFRVTLRVINNTAW